jgi:hypothetical protein
LSLPKEKKKSLNLEKDLVLTKEDLSVIGDSQLHESRDLNSYLDFLDELWRSERERKVSKKFYSEPFRL